MAILSAVDVVRAYIDSINRQKLDRLARLMTDDHVFVDSLGNTVRGRETMRQAWEDYYRTVPDYAIVVHQIIEADGVVGVFGIAQGTYAMEGRLIESNQWHVPAAWRAVVREDRIAKWQIYVDNEPIRALKRLAAPR